MLNVMHGKYAQHQVTWHATSYTLRGQRAYADLFPSGDPIQSAEASGQTYSMWVDLNGDGLDDLLWAKAGGSGAWTVRFNNGKGLGNRITFATNLGIEHCTGENDPTEDEFGRTYCEKSGYAPGMPRRSLPPTSMAMNASGDPNGRASPALPTAPTATSRARSPIRCCRRSPRPRVPKTGRPSRYTCPARNDCTRRSRALPRDGR
jgi:hypothetical protein